MTALWHHLSVCYRKIFVRLWYMLNRALQTNLEPGWPPKSNLELRWPPFVCHVIWAAFATPNARTFVHSEDSETFVRRASRIKKKRAYERIETYVRNGPVKYAQSFVFDHCFCPAPVSLFLWSAGFSFCPEGNVSHLCWAHSSVSPRCM